MPILHALDHLVMTVRSIDATLGFYEGALKVPVVRSGDGNARVALQIGEQKINLHEMGREIEPHADRPTPGAVDLCFLVGLQTPELLDLLDRNRIEIELGPVQRDGATGELLSVYVRDPDGNLVELAQKI